MTINGPDPLPLPQSVLAPLTRAAIFLVVTVNSDLRVPRPCARFVVTSLG